MLNRRLPRILVTCASGFEEEPKVIAVQPPAGWRLGLPGGRVRGEERTKGGHQEGFLSLNIGSFPPLKTIH